MGIREAGPVTDEEWARVVALVNEIFEIEDDPLGDEGSEDE